VVVVSIGFVTVTLESFTSVDRVGMITVALIALGGLWLLNRPRIKADVNGLEVVNVFRRRRLAWAEVVDVSLRPDDPWLVLDLDDGTTLAAMGVQTSDGERARAAAGRLRALVEAQNVTPTDN
jgi:hypothetical protein